MLYLAGAKAFRADIHLLGLAVYLDRDLLDIGIPNPVGSSVGVADVISEMSALAANFTLCHGSHLLTLYYSGSTTEE